ncbi:MAG: hypothetical protein ACYCV4_09265 [Dermatophilaceae bacterium]
MTVTTDPVTLLSAALDQTGAIIVGIRDDQQHLPLHDRLAGFFGHRFG